MQAKRLLWLASLLVAALGANKAVAIPALQLYIEGATYDSRTETWVITEPVFKLWVIGNVGHFGTIYDVKLAAAVKTSEIGPTSSITLTPTKATPPTTYSGDREFDPSTPPNPTPTSNFPSPDGAKPVMHSGRPLPRHEIYVRGVSFYEWSLGNFTLTDSPIGDFINNFPTEFPKWGQINAYIVEIRGFSWVHFDAYGYIIKPNPGAEDKFAPLSHDAHYTPEPGTLALFLVGGAILAIRRRRSKA